MTANGDFQRPPTGRFSWPPSPAAAKLPSAATFTRQYRRAFDTEPGVWGVFAFDSANVLFSAMRTAGTTRFAAVLRKLRRTSGYRGATGSITIDPATGYRRTLPVSILSVDANQEFVIRRGRSSDPGSPLMPARGAQRAE